MRFYKTLSLFFAVAGIGVNAQQDFTKDYTPLKSTGTLPDAFCQSTQKKIEEDNKQVKNKTHALKKTEKNFNIESNYGLDAYLLSGDVLVNDKVSIYLNKIADVLLKGNPSLRKELNFFAAKATDVNAFCYPRGYIFVNLSLIAQTENEAEIAFILSHEITHYTKKHSLNKYIEYKKIDKESYGNSDNKEKKLKKYSYSRESESEADIEGFKLYKASPYDVKFALKTFDILQYAYLPFDEVEFKRSFFEDKNYQFPNDYFLKETKAISGDDNYDDSKSSHPNIKKRKESIKQLMATTSKKPGEEFVVSEEDFYIVRETSRFELSRLYLVDRDYMQAFYNTYLLLNKYANNLYLHKNMAKVLYALCLSKSGLMKSNSSITSGSNNIEGKIQQVYNLFDKLTEKEMVLLAERQIWKDHKKFPAEPLFKTYSDTLMTMIANRENLNTAAFYTKNQVQVTKEKKQKYLQDSAALTSNGSKYDEISLDQLKSNLTVDSTSYFLFAFADFLNKDAEFKKLLTEYTKNVQISTGMEDVDSFKSYTNPKKSKKEKKKAKQEKGKLGINKIIVLAPYYLKYDERKKANAYLMASDDKQEQYVNRIENIAKRVNLDNVVIDPGSFITGDMQKFNDFSVLQDWLAEKVDQDFEGSIPVFNTEEMSALTAKYQTKYCLITGIKSIREKKKFKRIIADVILSCLVYPIPYAAYDLLKINQTTVYFSVLLNLENGTIEMADVVEIDMGDSKDMLNTYLYDTMHKIKYN